MTLRGHVHGAGGRMGTTAVAAIEAAADLALAGATGRGDDLAAALAQGRAEVLVEFTHRDALADHVRIARAAEVHVVSGTTGLDDDETRTLADEMATAGLGFVLAPNFSLGVLLMQRFAREASRILRHGEIVELHHDRKADAPSGTALATARGMDRPEPPAVAGTEIVAGARGAEVDGVRVHSVRLPGLLAHQEVLLGGPGELLTLRHDAFDRACFMPGLLLAVRRVVDHVGRVTMEQLVAESAGAGTGT